MRTLLMPALYETVILGSTQACISGLEMLSKHQDICRWVRKLAVRPNYYLAWPKSDTFIDEDGIADLLKDIVHRGWLHRLHTFDWDGRELAPSALWLGLRDHCPELSTVYANVGNRSVAEDNALFTFRNLKAFSFTVRHGLDSDVLSPAQEPLPDALWTMLKENCPDLEELNMCSFSPTSRLFDVSPITSARWPSLKCLVLGSFGYDSEWPFALNCDMDEVNEWVGKHEALELMRFVWNCRRWLSPSEVPALPCTRLELYSGLFQQIPIRSAATLTSLDLTMEPMMDDRVEELCTVLQLLTKLESLDIWLHSEHVDDVLDACPAMKEFHFMSTAKGDWAKKLCNVLAPPGRVPSLRVFSVTQPYNAKWGRGRMAKTAAAIAKANRRLEQVNLRWVREKCKGYLKHDGRYEVQRSPDGKATLAAWERGFYLFGRTFSREFKCPLY
ncbi:hypothetical protein CYLTODRAFT_367382 [Cylindrobasidium torrendii FP15055 ss-10]|uniref:F-box domain-containing protein n=1 Tax=Cylindrobasidium torrendii FP15055 ss-10 TaxID=1314674 RepID=A0A0D7BSN4_9AGAR|nr:hypothetical protein CYLTODRAFT_367382 [Cylindrobasidium torrendii FP15055 ss-10]